MITTTISILITQATYSNWEVHHPMNLCLPEQVTLF